MTAVLQAAKAARDAVEWADTATTDAEAVLQYQRATAWALVAIAELLDAQASDQRGGAVFLVSMADTLAAMLAELRKVAS